MRTPAAQVLLEGGIFQQSSKTLQNLPRPVHIHSGTFYRPLKLQKLPRTTCKHCIWVEMDRTVPPVSITNRADSIVMARPAGVIDEARVAVIGGSHGGFLTGNLVGQHPGRFRCGVLRNPVMDLGLMIHVSDIPDWVYVEAWGTEARSPPLRRLFWTTSKRDQHPARRPLRGGCQDACLDTHNARSAPCAALLTSMLDFTGNTPGNGRLTSQRTSYKALPWDKSDNVTGGYIMLDVHSATVLLACG